MREALFVKQNTAKWQKYSIEPARNSDELAERFIEITNDLSYAKTFYPKSKTTAYLNGLASTFHQSIYKNKKERSGRFADFWKTELPLVFRKYRRELLYSLLFFSVFCAMGAFSAHYDDQFVRVILGDKYVDMTNSNIEKGDPFGVYKDMDAFPMFLMIAANNIYVMLKTVVFGILASVGTVYALIVNGIMLGSFQYYFFGKGLGWESVLVIWIHGTLEISCIIISGAAGLVLGNSLLFPKTFTRLESLKRGVKDAVKIALGIVPIIIAAAILESYVTRHTGMPLWLSISILGLSFIFILWYVVWYPAKLSKSITE